MSTAIYADNGTEFSSAFTSLTKDGEIWTTSTANTPESYGLAEWSRQTIMKGILLL